jgi:hypothetical protein
MDDVIASGQKASPTPDPNKVPAASMTDAAKDKRWKQGDVVDVKRAMEGFINWYNGDSPIAKQANHDALMKACDSSDEMNADAYFYWKLLRARFETDNSKIEKAEAFWKAAGEKAA